MVFQLKYDAQKLQNVVLLQNIKYIMDNVKNEDVLRWVEEQPFYLKFLQKLTKPRRFGETFTKKGRGRYQQQKKSEVGVIIIMFLKLLL